MSANSLIEALQQADMLEIDGLYAWQFSLQAEQLSIDCIDGRKARRWHFSHAQLSAAHYDHLHNSWQIHSDTAEHRLKCQAAFSGNSDDHHEAEPS